MLDIIQIMHREYKHKMMQLLALAVSCCDVLTNRKISCTYTMTPIYETILDTTKIGGLIMHIFCILHFKPIKLDVNSNIFYAYSHTVIPSKKI